MNHPAPTIGILGGGQLGRMLALAGYPLGLRFRFLDPSPNAPGGLLADHICDQYTDREVLGHFAEGLDLVTYEFENVPVDSARYLEEHAPVHPAPQALEVAQDRLVEKSFFQRLGIPVPPFAAVETREELEAAVAEIGLPSVLKTRRGGYDGKGQQVLREIADVGSAWESLGGTPLILEGFVPFERELSIIAVRNRTGETAFYPLVENHHREGILRLSFAPAPGDIGQLQALAEEHAARLMEALGYCGVLAIEFFERDGQLIVNEFAPRVHNSGHWTIEGAVTSQFENHLRAVLGWPLGSTEAAEFSAMVNLIGTLPDTREVLAVPGAHLHLYDKAPIAGRKIGHITLCGADEASAREPLERLRALVV